MYKDILTTFELHESVQLCWCWQELPPVSLQWCFHFSMHSEVSESQNHGHHRLVPLEMVCQVHPISFSIFSSPSQHGALASNPSTLCMSNSSAVNTIVHIERSVPALVNPSTVKCESFVAMQTCVFGWFAWHKIYLYSTQEPHQQRWVIWNWRWLVEDNSHHFLQEDFWNWNEASIYSSQYYTILPPW